MLGSVLEELGGRLEHIVRLVLGFKVVLLGLLVEVRRDVGPVGRSRGQRIG